MAVCAVCGQEMLTASSCTERFAELVDGRYDRIRWGALEGEPTNESCGDCGVDPGGMRHVGCDQEPARAAARRWRSATAGRSGKTRSSRPDPL